VDFLKYDKKFTFKNLKKILVIEDDSFVVNFIRKGLAEQGFEVTVEATGALGLAACCRQVFDLIILDIMLPDQSGFDVCSELRGMGQSIPVLMLTALGSDENIALGLNSGADDYLVKPFKFIVLLARINALLRRSEIGKEQPVGLLQKEIYSLGDLKMDDKSKAVTRGKLSISLTATEYRLLMSLMKNKGRVMTRIDLLELVWDINYNLGTNVVDVYINYLRKKIDGGHPNKLIHTIIGMGYVLKEA